MPRSLALALAAATLIGCSSTPEQPLLQQFFAASRLRDNTTLAGFAAAAFEPGTDGIITTFSITNVTPEQQKPLTKAHDDGVMGARQAGDAKRTPAAETQVVEMSINGGGGRGGAGRDDRGQGWEGGSSSPPGEQPTGETAQKKYVRTQHRAGLRARQARTAP